MFCLMKSVFADYVLNLLFLLLLISGVAMAQMETKTEMQSRPIAIAIHGGAGTILKSNMTPQLEQEYHDVLTKALETGYKILQNNGASLDAVEAVIRIMEDSPLFNAGKGSVFTNAGTNELDASIMDGKTRMAGAVARVSRVKNPISLARKVMSETPHVMLVGDGAEAFAKNIGVELVDSSYFYTEKRWEQLQKAKSREGKSGDLKSYLDHSPDTKFGTVGCVALDKAGNLSAGTSTGGMTNKRWGRVGDSPIIGAGTYADNATCAVSATGHGEYFIRGVIAYDIAALMQYQHLSVSEAANAAIHQKLTEMGGSGGVIALDRMGNVTMPFNTEGMYRGYVDRDGKIVVKIYKE